MILSGPKLPNVLGILIIQHGNPQSQQPCRQCSSPGWHVKTQPFGDQAATVATGGFWDTKTTVVQFLELSNSSYYTCLFNRSLLSLQPQMLKGTVIQCHTEHVRWTVSIVFSGENPEETHQSSSTFYWLIVRVKSPLTLAGDISIHQFLATLQLGFPHPGISGDHPKSSSPDMKPSHIFTYLISIENSVQFHMVFQSDSALSVTWLMWLPLALETCSDTMVMTGT